MDWEEFGKEFGLRLTRAIDSANMSQSRIARLAALSQPAVSNFTKGAQRIYLDQAVRLAKVTSSSLDKLAGLTGITPDELSEDERLVLRTFRALAAKKGVSAEEAILRLTVAEHGTVQPLSTGRNETEADAQRERERNRPKRPEPKPTGKPSKK
jgi:transcriptional regulator with XRE-family HTH domain